MNTLVEMKNVVKKFHSVVALNNISFDIKPGEVHVLLGENGAGKSTLMKILSGVYMPTSGEIVLNGTSYSSLTPKNSQENGISIIYQELSVINELSIMENLFVGKLPMKKIFGIFNVVDYKYMNKRALELMKKVGLHRDVHTLVEDISISEKQQVEIAKALASDARVIIMDEPTASLTNEEISHLFEIIRQLKSEGKGIVYISHKLGEIIEIGDIVTVLKDGCYVGTKNVKDVSADDLVAMMVGREIKKTYQNPATYFDTLPTIFEVDGLTRKDGRAKNISFKLHRGEILGFAGLVGSGRSEMMNSVFGSEPKKSGRIFLKGKEISIKNPYSAIKHGLAMVTENRRETGFFHNFDIKQNISILPFIKSSAWGGVLGLTSGRKEKEYAANQKQALNIKCATVDQSITELSGGNQQKVILGKWIAANSEIIIFDEPTKGIDVGSKSEIYLLMRKLADEGKGVLVVSSELPELLAICDTIAVFREGQIVKTFARKDATEENIIMASTGGN
ncbi:MAG: ATP-binding cassette domain-containing protein [Oscillospiraceae bacterium]